MKENNIRITEADAGGTIIIISKHNLHDEVTQFINNNQTKQTNAQASSKLG